MPKLFPEQDFAPGVWEEFVLPSSWQLQLVERGSGQYLTSEEFWSWLPFSCTPPNNAGLKADKESAPKPADKLKELAVAEAKDGVERARGGVCFFLQTTQGTAR